MVVEITGPEERGFERGWKPRSYASGGIPFSMEIELPSPRVIVCELRGMDYIRIAHARAGEVLRLRVPFDVSFDPADLARAGRSAGQ